MKLLPLFALLLFQDSPVKPVVEVAKKLDAGAAEFLKGASPAESWKPWPIAKGLDEAEVRKSLSDAGVKKLSTVGCELELHFFKDGKAVAHLKTLVYVEGAEAAFLEFEYKPEAGLVDRALPLDKVAAFQPEIADAAKALLKEIKAKKEKAIAFADPEKIAKRCLFQPLIDSARKEIEESKAEVADACEKIAALDCTEVRVGLDDCGMLALGEGDKPVGAFTLELTAQDGRLHLALGRFRPFAQR